MSAIPQILVGVTPSVADSVIHTAARFATLLHAHVTCVWVDSTRLAVEEQPDGTVLSIAMTPEMCDTLVESVDPELEQRIGAILDPAGVSWSVRAHAGLPSQRLALIADEVGAEMIIVGTREPGFAASLKEFFSGSVAAQLSHRQHRPVLVVPVAPLGSDEGLPWEREESQAAPEHSGSQEG